MSKLEILCINAHCPVLDIGTVSDLRKHAIQVSVISRVPAVVLLQDFKWTKITGPAWTKFPLPKYYRYTGTQEAALLVNESEYKSSSVNRQDLKRILDSLQLIPFNRLGDRFPIDFDPLSHMCIRHVQKRTDASVKILCISWHGKGKGMTNTSRGRDFKYLIEFLRLVKKRFEVPLLVAGSFNATISVVDRLVKSPFRLVKYEASQRRKARGVTDFIIASGELGFDDVSFVDAKLLPGIENADSLFDHDPLVARVTVNQS